LLTIGTNGQIINVHRKLKPTFEERLVCNAIISHISKSGFIFKYCASRTKKVWGDGPDGSGLKVFSAGTDAKTGLDILVGGLNWFVWEIFSAWFTFFSFFFF